MGTYTSICNSVIKHGENHIRIGLPNQDYVVCERIVASSGKTYYLLIACDGVSAAKYADAGSKYLCEETKKAITRFIKVHGRKRFGEKALKMIMKKVYQSYVKFVKNGTGNMNDYASTMELAIISEDKAMCLHAGDGLIVVVKKDNTVVTSSLTGHTGSEPGSVVPFAAINNWEFTTHDEVASVAVMSDGVYHEIVYSPLFRNGYEYDPLILLPLIDSRAHKNEKSFKRYQKSYIHKKLHDKAVMKRCLYMLEKGIITGIDAKGIVDHFEMQRPLFKFMKVATDDCSFAYWTNSGQFDTYALEDKVPNYYKIWLKENCR